MANPSPASSMFGAAGIDMNSLMSNPGQGGASSGKLTPTSSIYMGKNSMSAFSDAMSSKTGPYAGGLKKPAYSEDKTMSYEEAKNMPLSWDRSEISKFVSSGILYKIPGFSSNMGMPEIMSAWDDAVQASHAFSQGGGKKWTPQDVIDSYKTGEGGYGEVRQGDWMVDAATGAKVKYVGPRSKTQIDKNINLSSAEDVQAITTNALTQLLGRAPTDKEVAQYKATINGYEKSHPTVTKSVQQISAEGEAGDTTTTTTGGATDAGRQELISKGTVGSQEYNKYQAGTTYYNALLAMIGGS